eukprot:14810074-Alexandrium_andersonii.AAC.1
MNHERPAKHGITRSWGQQRFNRVSAGIQPESMLYSMKGQHRPNRDSNCLHWAQQGIINDKLMEQTQPKPA